MKKCFPVQTPSINTAGALVGGGTAESCDAPYLTSSPAHHLRALAQSTMWTKKQKDWAKTLNPKPRILHTSYNILDWLSDVFVMNEFLWYSTPTYLPSAESGIFVFSNVLPKGRYFGPDGFIFAVPFEPSKSHRQALWCNCKWWQCQFSSVHQSFVKGNLLAFAIAMQVREEGPSEGDPKPKKTCFYFGRESFI